ncbi:MAG: serine/threonine protein kinase [Myxococcales bacterium]|nr:serine/threonine protein kinase [Myxococcales bacterium]
MSRDCLGEQTLLLLMHGQLAEEARGEVEAHVDGCPVCRRAIAALACSSSPSSDGFASTIDARGEHSASAGATEPLASDLAPGTHVEHFRVERLLGRGGMGEVYLARDTQLDRWVALKVIRPEQALSAEGIKRLLEEARTTARFNHPNVVTIYHVGTTVDGLPYLALEFLDGETLRQRMTRGPLHLSEILHVLSAVASALSDAQAHGVLHRDLKPENIMQGGDGRVRVLDFGLAVLERDDRAARVDIDAALGDGDESVTSAELLTHSRALRGTPAYMAPEQWRGEPAGPKTDVWALGVMLFEAITGQRPFAGQSLGVLRGRIVDDRSAPSLEAFASVIPPALQHLCEACLEKRADLRPSVQQVIESLQTISQQATGAPAVSHSALAINAYTPPGARPSRAAGSLMTVFGALLVFGGLAALSGSIGTWVEGYRDSLTAHLTTTFLLSVLPIVGGAVLLTFGLRRPTNGVALMVVGLFISIIGGLVAVAGLVSAGDSKGNLWLGLVFGVAPLCEGLLLVVRAVRDLREAAREALVASAPQLYSGAYSLAAERSSAANTQPQLASTVAPLPTPVARPDGGARTTR